MELVGRLVRFLGILCASLLLLGSCTDARDSSPEVCPLLGSDIQSQLSQSNKERIFLNFGAPAQCNGTVTSWRYYSYNRYLEDDECDDPERYTSKFLVYRQTGDSTYEPVPGSTKSVTITLRCPSHGGFRSRVATLSQSEQFTIQQNDIVAACVMDTGSTDPLRIVGEGSTQSGSGQVYHYDVSGYQSCTTSELQSIDTQISEFTSRNGIYRLHLYAEVSSPIAQCSGGSNPPPFTPSVVSGTYLNTASPISCSDTITSWHYCYYPSAAADSQLTYTATVGVWRLNTALNQYELLPGSDHTLELVQPASTLPKIFCKTEVLEPSEYVRVQTSDVIGVSLPTQNPLPILASGANGYSLMRHNTLNASSTLQVAALSEVSSMALHLYPTIEFVPLPTTEPPTTTEAPTTLPPTTEIPTTLPPTTEVPTTISPTTELPTTIPPTTELPTTLPPTTEVSTTLPPTTEAPTTLPPTTEAPTSLPRTTEAPTIIPSTEEALSTTESPITTEAETTTKSEAMTTPQPLTTQETTTVQSTDSTTTQQETTEQTTTSAATNLPPGTTQNTNFPTDTTEKSTTAGEQGTTESSSQQQTTVERRVTTSEEEETTTSSSLSSSSQGVNAGDFAAIALGIVILIAVISVVAGVIAYKMKLCGGARKKGYASYSVTSDEVNVNTSRHDTLLRYSSIHGRPLELATTGHGVVHNIAPLYEKVDEDEFEGAPYEEPVVYINSDAQVQFSASGGGTAEYSFVLEQVIEGKKLEGEEDPYYSPANVESEIYAQLHQQGIRMIRDKDIETTTVLGQGQFGMVRKGIWRNQLGFIIEVAVKTIKATSDVEDKIKFLQEAAIMAQFKHPNVITLYGVVSTRGTTMIVVELLPKGDLKQYLDSMKPDPGELLPSFTPRSLLAFGQQIALGMHYLSSKGFVHRDLAARNILLSEGCICKIADFGMSRDLADEDYYVSHGGKVPIKWTAPEALHYRKYSTASDVWSYGCVLYEIWSLGQKPFGAMQNPEVVAKVVSGYRLPPPPGCPKAIYKLMIDCWNPIAVRRPGFRNILLSLLKDEVEVLRMPREAVGSNSLAAVLGASLDAGFNLYTELQTKYSNAMHTSM